MSKNIFNIIRVDVGDKKNVIEFWCWWHSWNNGDRHLMRGVKTVTNSSNLSQTYSVSNCWSSIIVANMEPNGISNLCFKAAIWLVIVGEYLIGWKSKSRMLYVYQSCRSLDQWHWFVGAVLVSDWLKVSANQYQYSYEANSWGQFEKWMMRIFYWRLMKKELWFLMDRKIGYSEWGRIDQRRYRCFRLVKKI